MNMMKCPKSGLMLPKKFIDEKEALKKVIDQWVDKSVLMNQKIDQPYFIVFHAKFDKFNVGEFKVNPPIISKKIPSFCSNQIVFWVCNKRGICEMLWMVPPKKHREKKLKVNFNKKGVAYLQAKGAMPSNAA